MNVIEVMLVLLRIPGIYGPLPQQYHTHTQNCRITPMGGWRGGRTAEGARTAESNVIFNIHVFVFFREILYFPDIFECWQKKIHCSISSHNKICH